MRPRPSGADEPRQTPLPKSDGFNSECGREWSPRSAAGAGRRAVPYRNSGATGRARRPPRGRGRGAMHDFGDGDHEHLADGLILFKEIGRAAYTTISSRELTQV